MDIAGPGASRAALEPKAHCEGLGAAAPHGEVARWRRWSPPWRSPPGAAGQLAPQVEAWQSPRCAAGHNPWVLPGVSSPLGLGA